MTKATSLAACHHAQHARAQWSLALIALAGLVVLLIFNSERVGRAATSIAGGAGAVSGSLESQPAGPGVGQITSLAIDPVSVGVLYAGTQHAGLYKSTNGGTTWFAINSGIDHSIVVYYTAGVALDPSRPNTVYATSGELYKSADAGANWAPIDTSRVGTGIITAPAIDAAGTLYIGFSEGMAAKSTDGGNTWTVIDSGLSGDYVVFMTVDKSKSGVVYAGLGGGLFKTTDGGASWSQILAGGFGSLAIDPSNSLNLYATQFGTIPGILQKSTDGGATWSASSPGSSGYLEGVAVDPADSKSIYIGTDKGLLKSSDGAESWFVASPSLPARQLNPIFDPSSPGTLYAVGPGLFKRSNNEEQWSTINTGLPAAAISVIAASALPSGKIYAGTDDGSIYTSTDGRAWSLSISGTTFGYVASIVADPANQSVVYASTEAGLLRTTDGGGNWSTLPPFNSDGGTLLIAPSNPMILYMNFGDVLYRSDNGGTTWRTTNSLPFRSAEHVAINAINVDPTRPYRLYAGATGYIHDNPVNGGVFKSNDGGDTWLLAGSGLSDATSVTAIAVDPSNPKNVFAGTFASGVFKSNNGALRWKSTIYGFTDFIVEALATNATGTVYAGTDGGVFRSIDGGKVWSAINIGGIFDQQVNAICVSPSNPQVVFVGTNLGVVTVTP